MHRRIRLLLIAALAPLAGCPLDSGGPEAEEPPVAHHAYLGKWTLDECNGSIAGNRECGDDDPDAIELLPDRFDEYRDGALHLSVAATYLEGQHDCPGEDRLVLDVDVDNQPDWCLTFSDGERLDACWYGIPDGLCWTFRR